MQRPGFGCAVSIGARGFSVWRFGALLALLAGCAAPPADADPGPIVTDRPDRTESSATVDPGLAQYEWGWTRSREDERGVETVTDSVAESLLRIGLVPDLELRLGFAGFIGEEVDDGVSRTEESGAGDGEIGGKWRFLAEGERVPEAAIIAGVSVPTGAIGSPRFDPAIALAISKDIDERFGVGSNLGVSWASEESPGDDDTLSQFDYTLVLSAGITDELGCYLEYFGSAGLSRDGGPENVAASGLTWLLQPNLQLDLSGGVGLSEDADDLFIAIGFSYRYPR